MSPYTDGIYTFRFSDDEAWIKLCQKYHTEGEVFPDLTQPFEEDDYKHLENQNVFIFLDGEEFLYYAKKLIVVLLKCNVCEIHVHMGDKVSLYVADKKEQILLDDLEIFKKEEIRNVITRAGL